MKWWILIFLILPLGSASEGQTLIEQNVPWNVDGKSITFVGTSRDQALFVVDGVEGGALRNTWSTINGVEFYYTDKTEQTAKKDVQVIFNYSIAFVCGDGTCNANETVQSCCSDCGCDDGECYQNQCIENLRCRTDFDCNDEDSCTTDRCRGFPPACVYDRTSLCQSGDSCCPLGCSDLEDADCYNPECRSDADCEDNNSDTQDSCMPPGMCEHVLIEIQPVAEDTASVLESGSQGSPIRWDVVFGALVLFFLGFYVAKQMK